MIERIAAGEAIERPAFAVKELIENALDAGATEIDVDVGGGGLDRIRVSDNGLGIPATDMDVICQRHTTSKVSSLHDLDSVITLGFRGEALASLVAVASVSVISATADSDTGWQVRYEDGVARGSGAAPRRMGTTVAVRRLFAAMPGRRKFLGAGSGETARIALTIRRYALAHPGVRFSLVADARLALRTSGSGRVDVAMGECWSAAVRAGLLELAESESAGATIEGWIGDRSTTRPSRSAIVLVINGRPVEATRLQAAMETAYRPMLPRGRHPFALIRIRCDPGDVDANVHPAKTAVLLRRESEIALALGAAVRGALGTTPDRPAAAEWALVPAQPSLAPLWPSGRSGVQERSGRYGSHQARADRTRALIDGLPQMRLLGQVRNSLIAVEGADGLYLIDQHRAHERVLYERLLASKQPVISQTLLEPMTLELKRHEAELFQGRLDQLQQVGFQLERAGGMIYLVHALPTVVGAAAPLTFDDELVQEIALPGDTWRDRLHVSVACRAALRRGQPLEAPALRHLLAELATTGSPAVCPHGSPLILEVTGAFLERQFDWR
jgi:DNA mismatch repair protein MutL